MRKYFVIFVLVVATICASSPAKAITNVENTPPKWNVLVIKSDDQPKASMSAMTYLSSEPGGRWVNFKNAYYNQGLCCPERCSWWLAMFAHLTGVTDNHSGEKCDEYKYLSVDMKRAGYRVGMVGKHINGYCSTFRLDGSIPPGFDYWRVFCGSKNRYTDFQITNGRTVTTQSEYVEKYLSDRVIDAIDTTPTGQPWMVYWGARVPHLPRTVCREHSSDTFSDLPVRNATINPTDAELVGQPRFVRETPRLTTKEMAAEDKKRLDTYKAVRCLDDEIKKVFEHLQAIGQWDNTLIVYQSDNGYSYGEKRQRGKNLANEVTIQMPLYMRVPSVPFSGITVDELVTNVDVGPTIADFSGATINHPVSGESLRPLINGFHPSDWRDAVLVENRGENNTKKQPKFWAARSDGAKLVVYDNPLGNELYLSSVPGGPLNEMWNRYNEVDAESINKRAFLEQRIECIKAGNCIFSK